MAKKRADLKSSTEALICAAQEQALRRNYVNFNVDRRVESPLCREVKVLPECECSQLAQKEYKCA